MKAIFVLPGLLAFVDWFLRGYTAVRTHVGGFRVAVAALIGAMVALLTLDTGRSRYPHPSHHRVDVTAPMPARRSGRSRSRSWIAR